MQGSASEGFALGHLEQEASLILKVKFGRTRIADRKSVV